ncbi:glycosyltransferase family 2 protein [Gallintestinimicrobium sp.]|uniref:glycosyltransferase family 2 protein n=1 Tax=Gallintestinimicrobium sp. TaxID=2981655 RepID=UPI0039931ED2
MNYENLISIVMPVFNAQAYLEEALESVRRQTWTDWELLVVDDHSTDGSAGLVSEICRKDARIRLLSQTDGVKGAANARNFGTAHANGRYLAFMDADDIWRWTAGGKWFCGRRSLVFCLMNLETKRSEPAKSCGFPIS